MLAVLALLATATATATAVDLRRATHANQITIDHDPLTDVWDKSTGELRPHAGRIVESRWRSAEHSSVRGQKRGVISDAIDSALHFKDDDGWGISIAQLENYHQDNEWLADVGVGTPAQSLKVVLDTGSAGGWIYSPACCYASNHSHFDPTRSPTYSNRTVVGGHAARATDPKTPGTPWNSTYGGAGNGVAGYLGYDSFSFANGAINVDNATTALVTSITGDPNSRINRKMEGLIGLMPARVIDEDVPGGNWTSPIEQALRTNQLAKPYLAATFVKARRRTGRGGGGRYTFGDVDHAAVRGDLTWINATSATYWGASFDSLSYGDDSIKDPQDPYHRAIVDTGTALLLLSPNAAEQVNNRIYGSYKRNTSQTNPWLVPCRTGLPEYEAHLPPQNRTQPFYITLSGRKFGIPIEDFAFWPLEPVDVPGRSANDPPLCLSAFQPSTAAFTVIGDVFFKNHAVVFDFGTNVSAGFTTGRRIAVGNRKDVVGI